MEYAPVIIPTLSRYEHFKQCIESLEECTGAELTDVYIGVDHPTKASHVKGHTKILEYLNSRTFKFRSTNVIIRPYNFGLGYGGNGNQIYESLKGRYDTYISFDDDCVFSKNFLEYINKGLEKYKDDDTVYAICGYTQPYGFDFQGDSFCHHHTDFSTWGYGSWFNKKEAAFKDLRAGFLRKSFSLRSLRKIHQCGLYRLLDYFIYMSQKNPVTFPDCAQTCYLILKDYTVIIPAITKVRNIGWDKEANSNINLANKKVFQIAQRHKTQEIDKSEHFDFIGDGWNAYEFNNNVARDECEAKINFGMFIKRLWILFLYRCYEALVRFGDKHKKTARLYG